METGNMKQQRSGFGLWQAMAAATLLLLTGCAAGAGGGGQAVLPPPPAEITPFGGAAHQAAKADPALIKAEALDSKGDTAAAAEAYRIAGEAGNPIAHYLLGSMFTTGDGVPRDSSKAVQQLHAAAMAGYAPAQAHLGDAYEKGFGVAKDQAIANRWYAFAAAQGEDTACGRLAMSKLQGDGMPRDVDGALKMLRLCADPQGSGQSYYPSGSQGGPGCQALLGGIYIEGIGGVPVDLDQGVKWLTRASYQHMPVAEKHLADLYERGKGVPVDKKRAQYWREEAEADADKGPGYWMQL